MQRGNLRRWDSVWARKKKFSWPHLDGNFANSTGERLRSLPSWMEWHLRFAVSAVCTVINVLNKSSSRSAIVRLPSLSPELLVCVLDLKVQSPFLEMFWGLKSMRRRKHKPESMFWGLRRQLICTVGRKMTQSTGSRINPKNHGPPVHDILGKRFLLLNRYSRHLSMHAHK